MDKIFINKVIEVYNDLNDGLSWDKIEKQNMKKLRRRENKMQVYLIFQN